MTRLNAFEEKSWTKEKSNPNNVVNEPFVKSTVMNDKLVKNIVVNAKMMDLSIFKIGGLNNSQSSNQERLEEFIDENETLLLIGIHY